MHTLPELIFAQSASEPESIALLAPGRNPLSYSQFTTQIQNTIAALHGFGIGRGDRVGIVLPNGPEMASAFISIASGATSAPLNPAYREAEYDFYLSDLSARAVVIQEGLDSPARISAEKLGIPILELCPGSEAGSFNLRGTSREIIKPERADPEDIALVLHTSGTTARPKIVPLSHENLIASAGHIRSTLRLTHTDRCLNIMPLFHIHGLMAATLASLSAGACEVCTPGFYAPDFYPWLDEFKPTWYTAVPTMHQSILTRAGNNQHIIARNPLRLIRSSSASLPPQVMADLEQTFNAPVIESYGMTEASHQMASNPLPPAPRKPGSVGLAAGPEVAIMAEESAVLLKPGGQGEIVIRGPNVTRRYESNPDANAKSFVDGWFRTGDLGWLDEDGYLFISGRLKEIINRGGEKISPREVDEVLLDHPAVSQAVTFAVPHPELGEAVAAAVVLLEGGPGERELRDFAATRLSDFKVPQKILVMDEIPKGPTGKLQRIGLAKQLGLGPDFFSDQLVQPADEILPPRTTMEKYLAGQWCELLRLDDVGVNQSFLTLGGDSMIATRLVSRIQQGLDLSFSIIDFFDAPTIAEQAILIEDYLLGKKEEGRFDR